MNRRTTKWWSPTVERDMHVAMWGDRGVPLVLFPTAGGDYLECERFHLIRAISPLVEDGRLRVYACGSISGDGWLNADVAPDHKSWLQARFDDYVAGELVPFIRHDLVDMGARLIGTGASLGAYNAVNAHARHPDLFRLTIAMSGTYDMDRWMHGHADDHYYFNQPLRYVPNLGDGPQLQALRDGFFLLASGQGRWEAPQESVSLGQALGSKGIPNYVELWGKDVEHEWPTWRTMLPLFLQRFV